MTGSSTGTSVERESGRRNGSEDADGSEDDRFTGRRVTRREDDALLTGRAEYTDDLSAPGMVHLAFVRSEYGHATVEGVDASVAESLEGVLGVYTWDDLDASETPGVLPIMTGPLDCEPPGHPVLARERVRYQGQPIAAVVAVDRYLARDAVEAVDVGYEPLETVVDPVEATAADAPTVFEAAPDNVVARTEQGDPEATDEAFAEADRAVDLDLVNNRLIPSAIEPRAALGRYDPADDRFTVEMTSQSPHGHRGKLAKTLGVPERKIRVISPHVGGGFGHKGHHHPGEAMAAWAARELERPVKWTATRSENYLEGAHGRDHVTCAELAIDDDGTIRGLRVETHANVGGYGLGASASMPGWYGSLLSSQYRIPAIHCETRAVVTNTAPIHSYRGAGRPEAIYVTERIVDVAARELGMDPVEVRRRNQIGSEEFPYETAVGASYDSGDYETAMATALEAVGYDDLRAREDDGNPDEDGRLRGVGVACYTESTGGGYESGVVRVDPDGGVTVSAGTHSHGQGHATTYAQLVADALELPLESVDVREGDTDSIPTGTGTFGSRSTITGGSAVVESAEKVLTKAKRLATARLEVDPEALEYAHGEFFVPASIHEVGDETDENSISFEDVAEMAYGWGVPPGVEPGLEATTFYEPDGTAYSFGTHVAIVAIDPDTGELEIERYVAVDDCGERVNPTIVEGQIHGGVAQGIGQAVYEGAIYDADGSLVTRSLEEYAVPRAAQLPDIETLETVTPSPRNPLGVKGIGEAGTIAAPPTIVNAVVDALAHLGVEHVDMPLSDERIWRAMREAEESS